MKGKTAGFVGAGRVARIILGGLKKAGRMPGRVVVSDTNPDVLQKLQSCYPEIGITPDNNREAAGQDLVFLGLHPPVLADALADNIRIAETQPEILDRLKIRSKSYFLLTLHRPYTVDEHDRLESILEKLGRLDRTVIFPVHPRTRKTMNENGIDRKSVV